MTLFPPLDSETPPQGREQDNSEPEGFIINQQNINTSGILAELSWLLGSRTLATGLHLAREPSWSGPGHRLLEVLLQPPRGLTRSQVRKMFTHFRTRTFLHPFSVKPEISTSVLRSLTAYMPPYLLVISRVLAQQGYRPDFNRKLRVSMARRSVAGT